MHTFGIKLIPYCRPEGVAGSKRIALRKNEMKETRTIAKPLLLYVGRIDTQINDAPKNVNP